MRFTCLFFLGLLLLAPPAAASTVVATSIAALAQQADAIVIGQVSDVRCTRVEGHIVTETTLELERSFLPDSPIEALGDSIVVRAAGGRLGGFATRVAGTSHFTEGERVLVFLSRAPDGAYVSTSMSFSKFTLNTIGTEIEATRDPQGLVLLSGVDPDIVPPDVNRNAFNLEELEAIIASALEQE